MMVAIAVGLKVSVRDEVVCPRPDCFIAAKQDRVIVVALPSVRVEKGGKLTASPLLDIEVFPRNGAGSIVSPVVPLRLATFSCN
jgi:hypothetical protein